MTKEATKEAAKDAEQLVLPGMEDAPPDSGYNITPVGSEPHTHEHNGGEDKIPVTTAFVVYLQPDGRPVAATVLPGDQANSSGLSPIDRLHRIIDRISLSREATLEDMVRCSREVTADIERTFLANAMLNLQVQYANQMAREAQTQAMLGNLNLGNQKLR